MPSLSIKRLYFSLYINELPGLEPFVPLFTDSLLTETGREAFMPEKAFLCSFPHILCSPHCLLHPQTGTQKTHVFLHSAPPCE